LKPDFWNDTENAGKVQQEISDMKEEIGGVKKIENELQELKILGQDDSLKLEIEEKLETLEELIEKQEFKTFLSGKYDKNSALLEIFSGAGGQDSQDWATMLLRMYERYCAAKGFKTAILHQAFGEAGGPEGRIGTKSVTMEIKGDYAYGFLKKEFGVHRLVRISPFNAQKLRQTSFALVNVLPEIPMAKSRQSRGLTKKSEPSRIHDKIGINDKNGIHQLAEEIKPEDLRVDTFRASGPGGQNVNKIESAVRITHIPTGIVVASQTERLQGKNKENAMKILYAKLFQLEEQTHAKKIKEIKGDLVSASWGNQIRSYVLHPYKMVKDLRTQYETSDTEGVLDGDLEKFIEAELKSHNT